MASGLGRRIGAYELVALIGQGGMGEVYRARRVDSQYEKEVAIKLVPAGYPASHVLERMRAERQILATLEHPNIARLIDGGATEQGLPYLIMELVDGEPLDRYCEQRSLSVRERLRLFLDVCSAVGYAHQRLVVHRDLKPGNILVTADGAVKLLDFGIAKLLQPGVGEADAAPTVTFMQMLTPRFASPEQILGRPITTASDVYSLGVLLYLLLTGNSPYRTSLEATRDAIREVCETEPPPPSAVAGRLDRDLDDITLRALRKEPQSRYLSVDQFAEDIRRHLSGLPVVARGDQFAYRAGKFMRRHKLELAAAGLVAVALVGGIVTSVRQARIAQEQTVLAEQQRARAERHFASVRKLADVFMFEVHDAIEDLPGSTDARRLLVSTALEYLSTLSKEAGQDRGLQQELAAAYYQVATIQGRAYSSNTGRPREAMESYGKAIALLEPIVAADPSNTKARTLLARSSMQQSRLLLLRGESAKAVAASQRAITILESIVQADPNEDARRLLSHTYGVHGYNLDMAGPDEEAGFIAASKGTTILEDLVSRHPQDDLLAVELSQAYNVAATVLQGHKPDSQRLEVGLAIYRKALALDEHLVAASHGNNSNYVRSLLADRVNIASLLYEKGDYRGAVAMLRAAMPLAVQMHADKENAQASMDESTLRWQLGRGLLAAGKVVEAKAVLEENVAALRGIAQRSDTLQVQYLLAASEQALGQIHARAREWSVARELFARAIPRFRKVTASVTLDYLDQRPVDEARAGLAQCEAEIAKLQRT